MSPISTNNQTFINDEEVQSDVPSGELNSGYIGNLSAIRAWDCGWVGAGSEFEDNGRKFGVGRAFIPATNEFKKPEAEAFAKDHALSQYVNAVYLLTMPLASVTNLDDEKKAKFKSAYVQGAARIVGLKTKKPINADSQKYSAGLGLVTLVSAVQAYALWKGWIKEPVLEVSAFSGLDKREEIPDTLAKLVACREVLWAALGEANPDATFEDTTAKNLKEALEKVFIHNIKSAWAKIALVNDPSPKAFYMKNVTEEGTGESKEVPTRNRVPFIVCFYNGEKDAVDAGKAESGANESASKKDFTAVYLKMSEATKATYSLDDFEGVAQSILDDLKSGAKLAKLATDYSVTVADVNAIKAG